jgi:four helix bundle protein
MAMDLSERVYRLTWTFPRQEMYGLSSQLQRASVSIPSNIAEGRMRGSLREYAHFIAMARGSLAELRTQLILAQRLEYSTVEASTELAEFAERLAQRLNALRKSLISHLELEQDQPKTEHPKPNTERGLSA